MAAVGSVTEKRTTGSSPGAVFVTDSTLNWKRLPASTVGTMCTTAARSAPLAKVLFGPWQALHWSSVEAPAA